MDSMVPKLYSRVRAAAIDGRAQNPFYRKTQLKKLHDVLIRNHQAIEDAIARDTGYSTAEVKIEFSAGIKCVKDQYESIDPQVFFKAEYRIADGKDAADNREAVGVVVIEPTTHTLFFSILSALTSAIAAGNCVILQVRPFRRARVDPVS
jgi:acyl-CoA reductase-like NAD-dependent aldehyde dehydrogenase